MSALLEVPPRVTERDMLDALVRRYTQMRPGTTSDR